MAYSLKQAAQATGRTKPAILRAIQTGKVSAKKRETGEWEVEPSELHRVYPPVTQDVALTGKPDEEAIALLLLRQELTAQAERLTALQEERERERERERRQLTERIIELRDQLAKSEEERREKDRQLIALLTDQSGGEKGVSVPDAVLPPMLWFFKHLRLLRR